MPLYPYRCTKCGYQFEKIQSFDAAPETACPECGGKLERPLTVPGLSFKGSGWYITDYSSKGGGGSKGEDAGSKPESKPESKPAAAEGAKESKPATSAPAPSSSSSSESKS